MKQIGFRQLRYQWKIYLLVLPALAVIALFSYFPAVSAMYYSFFHWNGDDVAIWAGSDNFTRAIQDEPLYAAFGRVLILIGANLFKMVPSIITAVVIHRLVSDRARYIYRVAFVIPMVIPQMVWLLIWKYFYNPQHGVFNKLLNMSGGMDALNWMDRSLPQLAADAQPIRDFWVDLPFGSPWGLMIFGVMLVSLTGGLKQAPRAWWSWLVGSVILGAGALALIPLVPPAADGDASMLRQIWQPTLPPMLYVGVLAGLIVLGIVLFYARWQDARQSRWVWWMIVLAIAWLLMGPLATAVWLAVAVAISQLILRYSSPLAGPDKVKLVGTITIVLATAIVLLTMVWTRPTDAFSRGAPAWLGDEKLIMPALIFWGFPWVGVVSVLLYLSGLGNIDQSVYEAADIDGCGAIRKFWNIELPLIMTQVRLTLVLMVIGTLQTWGLIYILLGDGGGPGGAGMVPGLYMFRKAFVDSEAGYASAIGLLLFFVILGLTLFNNKYVRVEK